MSSDVAAALKCLRDSWAPDIAPAALVLPAVAARDRRLRATGRGVAAVRDRRLAGEELSADGLYVALEPWDTYFLAFASD